MSPQSGFQATQPEITSVADAARAARTLPKITIISQASLLLL